VKGCARQIWLLHLLWKRWRDVDLVITSCKTLPPPPSSAVHPKQPLIGYNSKTCFQVGDAMFADVFGNMAFTLPQRSKSISSYKLRYMIDGVKLAHDLNLLYVRDYDDLMIEKPNLVAKSILFLKLFTNLPNI
jgi:hypothetical protein